MMSTVPPSTRVMLELRVFPPRDHVTKARLISLFGDLAVHVKLTSSPATVMGDVAMTGENINSVEKEI